MKVRPGTSGFSYKEWKGSFYPEDLPAKEMLSYYARRLPAVEINNTFYRLQTWKLSGHGAAGPKDFLNAEDSGLRVLHNDVGGHAPRDAARLRAQVSPNL